MKKKYLNEKEITKEMLENILQDHYNRVNESIKNNKLYAYCIYGHKHYIKSFEEYEEIVKNDYPMFIYGL